MKKIDLKDKAMLKELLNTYEIKASELSFTNLYAWRDRYNFHYILLEGYLWIINISNDKYYLSQPIGDYSDLVALKKSIKLMSDFLDERPFIIKKADDKFIHVLASLDMTYTYKAIRDDFDYVYDFSKMKSLSGNKYHKKKNHLNKFKKSYSWSFRKITKDDYELLLPILDDWFEDKDDLSEKKAICDVLLAFETLDVTGGLLFIEEKPVGFIIGEELNKDTMVIHFEKGLKGYHGIYPTLFHEYIQGFDYTFVNREQDLGIAGLRKSKLSYHPIHLVEKYNVRLECKR